METHPQIYLFFLVKVLYKKRYFFADLIYIPILMISKAHQEKLKFFWIKSMQQLYMIPMLRESILKIKNTSKNNILYVLQLLFSALKIY